MNNQIFYFFYHFAHQSKFLDQVITFFGVWFPFIVIILAGLFLLFHHEVFQAENPYQVFLQKKREILLVFFSGVLAYVLASVIKYFVALDRPFAVFGNLLAVFPATGHTFPSGHATFFMALATAIFFTHKKAGYVFAFFALLIGVARIMGGVHFPADILGGFVLGIIVAYLVAYLRKTV